MNVVQTLVVCFLCTSTFTGTTVASAGGPSFRHVKNVSEANLEDNFLQKRTEIERDARKAVDDVLSNVMTDDYFFEDIGDHQGASADAQDGNDDRDAFGDYDLDDLAEDGEYERLSEHRSTNGSVSRQRRSPIHYQQERYGVDGIFARQKPDCHSPGEYCSRHYDCCSRDCSFRTGKCNTRLRRRGGGAGYGRRGRYMGYGRPRLWECFVPGQDCSRHWDCCSRDCSWRTNRCNER